MPRTFEKRCVKKQLQEAAKSPMTFHAFEKLPFELKLHILSLVPCKDLMIREKRAELDLDLLPINLMLITPSLTKPVSQMLLTYMRLAVSMSDLFPSLESRPAPKVPTCDAEVARKSWKAMPRFRSISLNLDSGLSLLRHKKQAADVIRALTSTPNGRRMVDVELVLPDPGRAFEERPFTYFCMFQTMVMYVKEKFTKVSTFSTWGAVPDDLRYYCAANDINLCDRAGLTQEMPGYMDHLIGWGPIPLLEDDTEGQNAICCLLNDFSCQHEADEETNLESK